LILYHNFIVLVVIVLARVVYFNIDQFRYNVN